MKSTEEIKNRLTLALHRRNLTPKESANIAFIKLDKLKLPVMKWPLSRYK